jgi:hypothetical protein
MQINVVGNASTEIEAHRTLRVLSGQPNGLHQQVGQPLFGLSALTASEIHLPMVSVVAADRQVG